MVRQIRPEGRRERREPSSWTAVRSEQDQQAALEPVSPQELKSSLTSRAPACFSLPAPLRHPLGAALGKHVSSARAARDFRAQ